MLADGSLECNDDGTACTEQQKTCTEDGRCLERTLECIEEQCPIIDSTDPAGIKEFSGAGMHTIECIGNACLVIKQFCADVNDCEREIRKCDVTRASASTSIVSTGHYEHCTVTAESGDTSLAPYEDLEYARGYWVYYFSAANDVPVLGRLERGYHLLEEIEPSDADWVARLHCEYEAEITAIAEYNRIYGTNHTVPYAHGTDERIEDFVEPEVDRLLAECPTFVGARLVTDPLERELTLRLSKNPSAL